MEKDRLVDHRAVGLERTAAERGVHNSVLLARDWGAVRSINLRQVRPIPSFAPRPSFSMGRQDSGGRGRSKPMNEAVTMPFMR